MKPAGKHMATKHIVLGLTGEKNQVIYFCLSSALVIYVIRSGSQKLISTSVSSRLDYTNPCLLATEEIALWTCIFFFLCSSAILSYAEKTYFVAIIPYHYYCYMLNSEYHNLNFYYQNNMHAYSKR